MTTTAILSPEQRARIDAMRTDIDTLRTMSSAMGRLADRLANELMNLVFATQDHTAAAELRGMDRMLDAAHAAVDLPQPSDDEIAEAARFNAADDVLLGIIEDVGCKCGRLADLTADRDREPAEARRHRHRRGEC